MQKDVLPIGDKGVQRLVADKIDFHIIGCQTRRFKDWV